MLEEMVASVMKKTLAQDFPHLKLPAAVFATIDSAAKSDAFDIEELIVHNEVTGEVFKAHITSYWYEYKLTVIDRFGNPDANYPALPGIKSKKQFKAGAVVAVALPYYGVVIASVTVFMVSCNFHRVGLSISMCYLFAIMIAPTYRRVDTVAVCVLILISWWLPGQLPYAENYDLFKHFLLRFSIIVGFIVLRSIFLRQSANERHIKEMGHAFIKLAYNDVMTETLNKKAMETYGTFIADKIAPERVSVIIFDVDDFKSYNDNYSHMKGDEALRRVAGSVVGVLAAADRYLFRFGGEEFVVILPDIGEEEARRIAGALLDAVRAAAVPREDLPDRHIVTASFGVACGTGRELKDFSLIAKADRQLYICKNNGKNCVAASGAIYR